MDSALLGSACGALLRNKLRSSLTVLGITIGIAAVICVVAIGKAGQARVEQQLNNLGDNFVWIEEGGRAVNGVRTGTHGTRTLVLADAVAIKNQIPLIKSVSPNVDASTQIIYGNQNWFTTYRGVSPEYFDIKRWAVDQGAVFAQDDVDRAADVCVIGRTVRDQLFGVEDPIGKVVRLRVVWGVFNNSNQPVAKFDYPKKQEAEAHAAKLTEEKKGQTFFVQPIKEAIAEEK